MSTFIRNLPFMPGRQTTSTPAKPNNDTTPSRPTPLGPALQPSASDIFTSTESVGSSSSSTSWSALDSQPSSSKRPFTDPSVPDHLPKKSRLNPPSTMPDESLEMLKQVIQLLQENNGKMIQLDDRMKALEGGWKGVEEKIEGLMGVWKGRENVAGGSNQVELGGIAGDQTGPAISSSILAPMSTQQSIAQLGKRLERFDILLDLPKTISDLVTQAVTRALHTSHSTSLAPFSISGRKDNEQRRTAEAGSSGPTGHGTSEHHQDIQMNDAVPDYAQGQDDVVGMREGEQEVGSTPSAITQSRGRRNARSRSRQGELSTAKQTAVKGKGKRAVSSQLDDTLMEPQGVTHGSESGTCATERLETPAIHDSYNLPTTQVDIAHESGERTQSPDPATGTARRRSGRPKKPITTIGALTQTTDGMVKARKRGNGGFKRRNTQNKKPRSQPANFYTSLAKLPATLKMSNGQKRGEGEWPERGPNNKKGIMQEIVCDTCKGRVHWSCAGLHRDDDPIEEWLCPDCVAYIDAGKHKDDIEQAPLDLCLRADCIRRWKQAVKKEEDDELQYQVEKIVGRRAYARDEQTKERYFEYLVKWVGWGMKDSTWEPRENIDGFSMIDTFIQEAKSLGVRTHHRVALLPEACKAFNADTGDPETLETDAESEDEEEEQEEVVEAGRGVVGEMELEGLNRGEKVLRLEEDEDEDYEKEEGAAEDDEEEDVDGQARKELDKEVKGLRGNEGGTSEDLGSDPRVRGESGWEDSRS